MRLAISSRAKLNLALDIRGVICNGEYSGYHEIDSVFCEIDLADELDVERDEYGGISLEVVEGEAPYGDANLVVRAFQMAKERSGSKRGARVQLRKRIPMMAGLGGGSSNAAASLEAARTLLGLGHRDAFEIAASLGSDVPFFLNGGLARAGGRGELLRPIESALDLHFVVAKPKAGVDTTWAYSEIDRRGIANSASSEQVAQALARGDLAGLSEALHNDFEAVVFEKYPEIERLCVRLIEAGALAAHMTGSGSAVFGLFSGRDEADAALAGFDDVWAVTATSHRRNRT